jgi:hypothetical protein
MRTEAFRVVDVTIRFRRACEARGHHRDFQAQCMRVLGETLSEVAAKIYLADTGLRA